MSINKLKDQIAQLPPNNRGPEDVLLLKKAAGKRIRAGEAHLLLDLLEEWRTFSDDGLNDLEQLMGKAAPCRTPSIFRVADVQKTGIKEQSALTFVSPQLGFIAVDDETSIVWSIRPQPGGKPEVKALRQNDGKLKGLEGAEYYDGKLYVVSEDSREVWRMNVNEEEGQIDLGRPKKLGKLDKAGKQKNKGWEGLVLLDKNASPDHKTKLIGIHEGFPRGIGIFDPDDLKKKEVFIEIPDSMKDDLADLSDATFDPKTGRLFLLSDESRTIVEVELRASMKGAGPGQPHSEWSMIPIGKIELDDIPVPNRAARLQPEGLACDENGDLWVACEGGTLLAHLERTD